MEKMAKIELFEDKKAENYEQFVDTWIPGYREFIHRLPAMFSHVQDKDLLVVGCGTGNEMLCFAESPDSWKITGVDPSPQMISQAKEKLAHRDGITFIDGLVSDMDLSHKYGAATLLLVMHFMKDDGEKLALLKHIAKRLTHNAPFVLLDATGDDAFIEANVKVLCQMLSHSNIPIEEIKFRQNRIKHELQTIPEKRIIELFGEAGFTSPIRFFQHNIYVGWLTTRGEI